MVRVNTKPTYPGVPVPPKYNCSGADWIELNWLRDYPEYHTGGAPIIGARVLMRPADHHGSPREPSTPDATTKT